MVDRTRIYNWYISIVAAMVMVLYGFDAGVYNAVQNSANWGNWYGINVKTETYLTGLINTVYSVGAIISGWFFAGPIADYFGRKAGMWSGCFITIIATFIQTFGPYHNLGAFIGGRVLIGFGQGIALTSGSVYINEVAPAQIRGQIMTFWQMFYSVGSFIVYWVKYSTSARVKELGDWDWKLVVILQILVPFIVCVLLPFQPESPRWWIKRHGNVEKARAALARIRATEQEVEDELLSIREAVEFEKEVTKVSYFALFKDPSVRKRLYLAFVINVGQQLTGQGTLNSYSSIIYKSVFVDAATVDLINALNATLAIPFTLNAMWTADRFGRRWLFMVGAAGMGLCMLLVPVVGLTTPDLNADGAKTRPVGIALTFLFFFFAFFYKPSWGATTWIWTSEIFSANVRAQAVGMSSQMQNVAQAIFNQFFPTFFTNCGMKTFFFFMTVNILLIAFVYFFVPETKQIAIEEIDVIFGGMNHVEKGGQIMGVPDAHHATAGVNEVTDTATDIEKAAATTQQAEQQTRTV